MTERPFRLLTYQQVLILREKLSVLLMLHFDSFLIKLHGVNANEIALKV